jgi:hypothetical protein
MTVVGATVYRVKLVTAVVAFVATSTPSKSGSRSTRKNVSAIVSLGTIVLAVRLRASDRTGRVPTWILVPDTHQLAYPLNLLDELALHLVKDLA